MFTRTVLLLILTSVWGQSSSDAQPLPSIKKIDGAKRRNVVFILTDDHR